MHNLMDAVDQILDEEVRQITELRKMSRVPRLLELMRLIVKASDESLSSLSAHSTPPDDPKPKMRDNDSVKPQDGARRPAPSRANGLTEAARSTIQQFNGRFSIPDIAERMQGSGFKFVALRPKVAIAGPIKQFQKNGEIRLVKAGIGSEPNLYERVKQEELGLR